MKTGSFEFYDNYAESAQKIQPEYYDEIRRILNEQFRSFFFTHNRKPVVIDIGSAGLLPYDIELTDQIIIFDLFSKPDNVILPPQCEWMTGNILTQDNLLSYPDMKFDFVIISSVLHHLCDEKNNVQKNLSLCLAHAAHFLSPDGKIFIFESTCCGIATKIQDFLYPLYSKVLTRVLKLTYVRMVSLKEIVDTIKRTGLEFECVPFRQPRYIAQMYWRVPARHYPLTIHAILAQYPRKTSISEKQKFSG